ncbi:hypothetical protein B0H12DRAFT_1246950 [Mycena haematopus]|nr:hypothetical protein B0H12DRAFT_1246950 [Mycena haematopus]
MLEIQEFHDYRLERVTDLANKYQKDESFFLKLLSNQSQYSTSRGMTLYNVIRHDLSVKAKDVGDSKNALDLNDELADGEYERIKASLTKDDENRLFAQLRSHRELKLKGIRATNRSAAADALQNANHIGDVIRNLFERTGVRALSSAVFRVRRIRRLNGFRLSGLGFSSCAAPVTMPEARFPKRQRLEREGR